MPATVVTLWEGRAPGLVEKPASRRAPTIVRLPGRPVPVRVFACPSCHSTYRRRDQRPKPLKVARYFFCPRCEIRVRSFISLALISAETSPRVAPEGPQTH